MTKKILWLLVSCLMALSLVMASCGPAATEEEEEEEEEEVIIEEEEEEVIIEEEEEEVAEEILSPEVPKYGGVLVQWARIDPMGFDDAYCVHPNTTTCFQTNEELTQGDWAKGPAGSGKSDWWYGFIGRVELLTGALAESWELPDNETIIYHIRKGIHWQDKSPVNGREFTAEDAAFNMERAFISPNAYLHGAYPAAKGYRPLSWKALDKYTVEVKTSTLQGLMVVVNADFLWHYPPDMIEKYGDMKDWRNACGTGPFMLTDYVSGSSLTYERNPDYWMRDPLHPENQLPYVDGVKQMIIPDVSTQLAALRTGKLDQLRAIEWDDAKLLMEKTPELQYLSYVSTPFALWGRMDKEELPFKDIRVRQALNLAVNQQEILDEYYDGQGVLLGTLWPPGKTHDKIYTPLEEQPEAVQEMFTYSPEKARALLAEAGYPDGFKTEIVCTSGPEADFLSIIREYFLEVGVDMEITPLERSVYTSVYRKRSHPEMLLKGPVEYDFPFRMLTSRVESFDDYAYFEHERTRACYEVVSANVGIDDTAVNRALKEIGPFVLEQAVGVWMPAPYRYTMWWPWLQNYYGVTNGGYFNPDGWTKYVWIDQALKESMGY